MNAEGIIKLAMLDGVTITLSPEGIRATGKHDAVARWLPILKEQKPILAAALLENERQLIMKQMVEWNERAAMMSCRGLTVEQAELAAWQDLSLDGVFFGLNRCH